MAKLPDSGNPYLDCRVEGAFVVSDYWRLECASEQVAKRVQDIISNAYRQGWYGNAAEVRKAIGLEDPNDMSFVYD